MPYELEQLELDRECLRLLQLVHGSRPLHETLLSLRRGADELRKQVKREGRDPSANLYAETGTLQYLLRGEETEASRITLTLAIIGRNSLDSYPTSRLEDRMCALCRTAKKPFESSPPNPFPKSASQVWAAFEREGIEPEELGLRDTCNKIIHAKEIEWNRVSLPRLSQTEKELLPGAYLDGFLWLYGDRESAKRVENWACMVNIKSFCLAANNHV